MALLYGQTSTISTVVTSKETGLPADAADLTFHYRYGTDSWATITPTRISTGNYEVEITPNKSGVQFHARWDTDGAFDTAKEFSIWIPRSAFENNNQSDYN
jgi:hypothetical protein